MNKSSNAIEWDSRPRTTLILPDEIKYKIKVICAKRMLKNEKRRYMKNVVADAIELLFQSEI